MAELSVHNLKKSFGDHEVLKGIDFSVESGKILSLLGPSGCGKSTILRIICGLETADQGDVLVNGRSVSGLRPEKRDIGLVFQNYALFPSMNVAKNVGYGLKMHKVPAKEIDTRVEEALELVKLSGYGNRRVTELSGGEQQRVALARSLVTRPDILLLDEPLSALDRKIRSEMQYEIRRIQQEVGITTVFVTHDQEEALTISDKIILLNEGRVEQEGDPWHIYSRPRTMFASDFIGKANLLSGRLVCENGSWYISDEGIRLPVHHVGGAEGDAVCAAVRGEYFTFCDGTEEGANRFVLEQKVFTGLSWKLLGRLGTQRVDVAMLGAAAEKLESGMELFVRVRPEDIVYYTE